jgi:hypothetical protein
MPPAEEFHLIVDLRQSREYVERAVDIGIIDLIYIGAAKGDLYLSAEIAAKPPANRRAAAAAIRCSAPAPSVSARAFGCCLYMFFKYPTYAAAY